MDIGGFINKIKELKMREFQNDCLEDEIKITYVGHSLGGMTLMMYLIHQKIDKKPHYLNQAILLSPAGFHEETSLSIKIIAWLATNVAAKLTDHIALPDYIIDLIQKLHKDLI